MDDRAHAAQLTAPPAAAATLPPAVVVRSQDHNLSAEEVQRRVDQLFAQLGIDYNEGLDFAQCVIVGHL